LSLFFQFNLLFFHLLGGGGVASQRFRVDRQTGMTF
jgi:hypothetical protein